MSRDIFVATFEHLCTLEKSSSFFKLGISSNKTALFLKYFFDMKHKDCVNRKNEKNYRRFYYRDTIIGGGLFVQCSPELVIDNFGSVSINFKRSDLDRYIRTNVRNNNELFTIMKDKLGVELKKMFGDSFKMNKDYKLCIPIQNHGKLSTSTFGEEKYIEIDPVDIVKDTYCGDHIEIDFNEYRTVYQFLRGRSKESTIKKYGEAAYKKMIGNTNTDNRNQFIQSMIDVSKAEIDKINADYNQQCRDIETEYDEICRNARNDRTNKRKEAEQTKNDLIKKIEQNIADLLAVGM